MRRRRLGGWQSGVAILAALVSLVLDGCKIREAVQSAVDYVTSPCPIGTRAVVSSDTGTAGLKKLVEKWCVEKGENNEEVRHGPYAEIFESGTKRESGWYVHGQRDGEWTSRYGNGRPHTITTYVLGKPVSFTAWHPNGQKWEEGGFVDGSKQGTWMRWYPNAQKEFQSDYDKGTLAGHYTLWHDNGLKQEQGDYKVGQRDGMWTKWFEDGQKLSEILFRDGKPEGWYRSWHENGKPHEQAFFKDGVPEGTYTIWHDNGQKEEEGLYRNGVLDGEVVAYDRDGKPWRKSEFKGGAIVDDVLTIFEPKSDAPDPLNLVPGE